MLNNRGENMANLNIWNKKDFQMCRAGAKCKTLATVRQIKKCIKWSYQRITRGYAECDKWSIDNYLQIIIPDMLQDLRDDRMGSPGFLGENYVNDKGVVVNDTCHEEWNKILDRMIFLWRETNEETCTMKNPYEEEYMNAFTEFIEKYGLFGEKLQTEDEQETARKSGMRRFHSMKELPEYKEICDKYSNEEDNIKKYRTKSKDEALDMLKEYFYCLWD